MLATASGAHFVHDGFSDVLYVLLPVWAAEFGLTFALIGLMRTVYSGGMALFQLPAGLLAERWGERRLLAAGTAVTAAGFVVAGTAGGFAPLLLVLLAAGLGSGVQHPLSSSLVSKAYENGPRRAALGTYNFAGDLGKVAVPATVALGAAAGGAGWGIRDGRGFRALAAVGMIDNGTRTALLTFLPFVLIAKGASVAGIGTALALVFAGGAVGKFVCGLLAERVGVIRTVVLTETATALGIVAVVAAPLPVALAILPPLGIALNGTSSVLYATVADLVTVDRRSRAYGLYYTLAIGASALAPSVAGVLGDALGPAATLVVIALAVLTTIPLCLALRAAVAAPARV